MANVTLSISENMLRIGREYANKHNKSLNSLVRDLLAKLLLKEDRKSWLKNYFDYIDKIKVSSKGVGWSRGDLHRV